MYPAKCLKKAQIHDFHILYLQEPHLIKFVLVKPASSTKQAFSKDTLKLI